MKRNTIRWVVLMAAFSIIGIVVSQIYWVSKAWDLRENQFSHRVDLALNDVFNRIVTINRDSTLMLNPVSRITNSQYHVELNQSVSLPVLEALLVSAFKKVNVRADFEYGVYDCIADTGMIGKYVLYDSTFISRPNPLQNIELPKSEHTYFAVYFPEKEAYLLSSMGFWFFSSAILLIVIIFFAYTTFIILRQKRMSEVTRDFINNMTHELKTPISTIAVSADVLTRENESADAARRNRYSHIIKNENERLKKQVERVLQIATLEKDEIQINKETLDVHKLIRELSKTMQVPLESKNGTIHTSLEAHRHIIEADRMHLMNILYNLVDNAIKYSGDRPPKIRIHTAHTKQGLQIRIVDNGIGINRSDLKMIFKKFFRVSTGNRHDVKGFGLGLAYVKMMVEKHNGKISVESEIEKGSTFTITLPNK